MELLKVNTDNVTIAIPFSELKELVTLIVCDVLERQAATDKKKNDFATLSSKDVQNILGVSKTTLWHWKNNGTLLPIQVGRRTLYKQSDITELLTKNVAEYE